jgi:hypothetical protein
MGKNHSHPSLEFPGGVGGKNLIIWSGQALLGFHLFIATLQYIPPGELPGGAHLSLFIIMLRDLISCCAHLGQKFSLRWHSYPLCTILSNP